MSSSLVRLTLMAALVTAVCGTAAAQGAATASLSGVVMDSGGGVLPGASIAVKNNATGTTFDVVTNRTGVFSVPALDAGTYTVTVTLMGFKTAIVSEVKVLPATPADLRVTLEIGAIEETIVVRGGTELVQTQSAAVQSTVNVDQIMNLPLTTRNPMYILPLLAGVNTPTTPRYSNINGLPGSALAITLDGVNNNENFDKSTAAMFAMVTPRQDAIEAVTLTGATGGSDVGGHGAVQIRFVTRSGTDKFVGSAYEYYRDPSLNTNYYFNKINNLPKNQVKLNQFGARQGGPILIPGVYNGRGKAYFFFNYEVFRMPKAVTRTRTVLNPDTQNGIFQYNATSGGQTTIRRVDILSLAARYGQVSTPDPTVVATLQSIRAATQKEGRIAQNTDPNTMAYVFQNAGTRIETQPTFRIDYNLSPKHRVTATSTFMVNNEKPDFDNSGDVRFPGMPNYSDYASYRNLSSGALRSTLTPSLVNELRGGIKWGPSVFGFPERNAPSRANYDVYGGNALSLGFGLTSAYADTNLMSRSAWSWNIDDTVTWQWRTHSVSFGASYYEGYAWVMNETLVPVVSFGVDSADPATAMFVEANFTGASSSQLSSARSLYALLTGRVTSISGDARLTEGTDQYKYLGRRTQRGMMTQIGAFIQDSWRLSQKFTLNGGLRWDVQLPFEPTNDIFSTSKYADLCGISGIGSNGECNLFKPGVVAGVKPTYVAYDKGDPGYNVDWNNIAPSIGFAWRPAVSNGFLRLILGDPEQATFRGGFSLGYNREGMTGFMNLYGANPGSTISVVRNASLGNLIAPGESYPLLLREASRLGQPSFPETVAYPIEATVANNINIYDPDIRISNAKTFSIGFQRTLSKDMAAEVRYVGTRNREMWNSRNYNEANILENGFLDEFKTAQANLEANIAANRGNTFKYFGPGSGTSPLPILLAHFNASRDSEDPAKYTGSNWTNSTFVGYLAKMNPNPFGFASTNAANGLFGNATFRTNALAAGLPANFFVLNPNVLASNVYKSDGSSNYNSVQLELRRRLSEGLQFTTNYQYARGTTSYYLGQRWGTIMQPDTNIPRHAFKVSWSWTVPVGREQRFGSGMSRWLDGIVGGWAFHGDGRFQNRPINFGNVNLVGMTLDELRDAYRIRFASDPVTGVKTVWMLPEDIILNTRRAFNVSATSPTGYSDLGVPTGRYLAPANGPSCVQLKAGDCAPLNQIVMSPVFTRFDMSLAKRFTLKGSASIDLRLDVMNVFDNVNFTPVAQTGSGATINQVTAAYTDLSQTWDPGGRLGQIVLRINW